MDDHQKAALLKNYKAICADMELDVDLEINIKEQKLFTRSQLENIKAINTQKGRIQMMLDILPRRGPEAFNKFLICIQDHYPWLSEKLHKSFEEEVNNKAPLSSDRDLTCVVDDSHSENPEQIILRKLFSMLTDEKTNHDSTDPLSVPTDVSLDMIESKVSLMSEKHHNLEKQVDDCFKALNISDKTKSLDVIVQDLADQNKSSLKTIVRLRKDLRQKGWLIQNQNEQIENLNSKIETIQEEKARFQTKLNRKARKIKELSEKLQNQYSEIQASQEKINELSEKLLHQSSEIKASREKINELNEIIQNLSSEIKDSQAKLVQLQKEQPMKPTAVLEQSKNIQIPNSKCEDLNIRSKHLMHINSHHEQRTFSTPSDIQRVPLERLKSVHEEVQDNNTKFPIIHHQKNISQERKRSKLERNSCPDGLAIRGSSNNMNKTVWRF